MGSSRFHAAIVFSASFLVFAGNALAQSQQAQGFAVERFYPSAAGGGWFVMDELNMRDGFGGAIELTTEYAHDPLVISNGFQHLPVVSDDAFANFSASVSYNCFRLYLDFTSPLVIGGQSGTVGAIQFTAPHVNLGADPDVLSDTRIGFDARLIGSAGSPFRLGLGAQLIVPGQGARSDYDSDGTVRAMFRLLFAGDVAHWIYAAQLGVHVRPLDDPSVPSGPRGSELLFGAAAGPRFSVGNAWALTVGPEVYGESAFNSFFQGQAMGVEGLLSARIEGTGSGPHVRVKLGAGGGLNPQFGAPEWRIVAAVELFAGRP